MPPGSRLLAFASRWFDQPTLTGVFEPLVADWQRESAAATGVARVLANLRGRLAFVTAFVAAYPRILRLRNPPVVTRRVVIRISAACAILAGLGLIPLYREVIRPMWAGDVDAGLLAAIILLPIVALVTAVLPFAMTAGIDAIRCHEPWPDDVERRITSRLILVVTVWMFVGGGWIIPALNHAWRSAVVTSAGADGAALARDVQDLSTGELLLAAVRPSRTAEEWSFKGSHDHTTLSGRVVTERFNRLAARELAMRLLLVLLPGLIALIRWRALESQNRRMPFKVAVVVMLAGMILGLQIRWQSGLPYVLPIRNLQPFAVVVIFLFAFAPRGIARREVNEAR